LQIVQTTFFIPIVTPRFLRSTHCRDEFLSFRRRMQSLGRNDLIFPVHYVGVDDVSSEETLFSDELAALRRSQWIDFRPLFYADPKSPEVRRWAGDLAASVLKTLRQPIATRSPQEPTSEHRSAAEAASEYVSTKPPVSRPSRDAQQAPARPTIHVQLSTRAGRGGPSTRILLITGAIALIIALGVGIFQLPRQSGAPTAVVTPAKSEACKGSDTALASVASRTPGVLTAAEECALKPKDVFRECADCPAMVVVPAGSFTMGSPASEPGRVDDEGPQHDVSITRPFAVGEFHVTVDEFKAFVTATGYDTGSGCWVWNSKEWNFGGTQPGHSWRDPGFAQTGSHPVVCVNRQDAQAYAKWLSGKTGKAYRLLSEAEWEYAARGRTQPGEYPRYFFGDSEFDFCKYGNGLDQTAQQQILGAGDKLALPCSDGYAYTSPVGSFRPNAFGLFDMLGNAFQSVEDCYHSYNGVELDGALTEEKCEFGVMRGGSWNYGSRYLRAAYRHSGRTDGRANLDGFRLARTLTP
jgi:formylglycine-generating enzyme required for sulfatase activity